MLKDISKNLDKFKFEKSCSVREFYIYKNIKIEFIDDLFFFKYYRLYYNDQLINLNLLERFRLKIIVKKLKKINNNNLKRFISNDLV